MSISLLHILRDRDNFNRYSRFINKDILPQETRVIINDYEKYFKEHPSISHIEMESFSEWFVFVQHSTYTPEKLEPYHHIFQKLDDYEETETTSSIVEKLILQDRCQNIADLSLRGAEGHVISMDDILAEVEDYNSEVDRVSRLDSFIVTDDIDDLLHEVIDEGFSWRMKFLNESVGNIRKGKLICFASRPNTGKTTFLASEATHVASQIEDDGVVLWFNNEEAGSDVKLRIIQAAIHWETEAIKANPAEALRLYKTAIKGDPGKIVLVDKADLSTKDIEEFVKAYNVKLIIFDQLWKVKGFEKTSSTDTARLGSVFQWAREIAKQHAPVLTVHQVKTEGEGVEYLTPSMLYLSGTVIQGEVDTLILMGRNYNPGQEQLRYIVIGKNKGAYGPDVNPELIEGKAVVMIEPHLAQFLEE